MFSLSKSNAKELIAKHLTPFMESNGFLEKKRKDTGLTYRRKTQNGFDGLGIGLIESYPGQRISYSVYKRINIVEETTDGLLSTIIPERKVNKESFSVAFSFNTIEDALLKRQYPTSAYLPEMADEQGVLISTNLIRDFMTEFGISMLNRFENIKELDDAINGSDFWFDDWQKPFNLGGDFYFKRLVIARLSKNSEFDEIVNKIYSHSLILAEKQNEVIPELSDETYSLNISRKYLLNLK